MDLGGAIKGIAGLGLFVFALAVIFPAVGNALGT